MIVISKSKKYISLHVCRDDDKLLSWEQLQEIKDRYFKDLDFIEVYPKRSEIINKANVRHLIHIKDWQCVKLQDLEMETNDIIFE